jgi:hypothetical protein
MCILFALAPAEISADDATNLNANAQSTPSPLMSPLPFEPSEQLVYEGELSKLLLRGVKVAEVRFTANRISQNVANLGTPGGAAAASQTSGNFRFTGEAVSTGFFPRLFGLNMRFRVESEVESGQFNVLRTIKHDEQGRRVRTSEAIFNQAANRVVWTERNPNAPATEAPRVIESPLNSTTIHDIISAFYFLRTQPLRPGQNFELTVSDSGRVYRIPVRVRETEQLRTVLGRVSTVRVEAEVFGRDRLISDSGQMSIWFTTDARRIPVRARVNHDFGTLELKLRSVGNAR